VKDAAGKIKKHMSLLLPLHDITLHYITLTTMHILMNMSYTIPYHTNHFTIPTRQHPGAVKDAAGKMAGSAKKMAEKMYNKIIGGGGEGEL